MGVLVENWAPVSVYADINLKMEYVSGTVVALKPVDGDAPAYVPVYNVNNPAEVRMAMIERQDSLSINTAVQGIGGLEDAAVVPDKGYDVYILVKDDLANFANSGLGAIACEHGTALTMPVGYGHLYASRPIRYFCCNTYDGAANYDRITPFVETAPRETFYATIGASVNIMAAATASAKVPIPLAVHAARKAQFPKTARSVAVQILATNNHATVGELAIYLNDGATPIFSLPNIANSAGNCITKTTTVFVPCHGAAPMDATDLMKQWITGVNGEVSVDVIALGYQL